MPLNVLSLRRLARILVVVAALAALVAPAASAHNGPQLDPSLTKLLPDYRGLSYSAVGPCAGLYRILHTNRCTHGPDPVTPGTRSPRPLARAALVPVIAGKDTKVECFGNGTSGKRVQVLYVHATDVPDNYQASRENVGKGAADVDRIFHESSAETQGVRAVRFVHDSSCNLSILDVALAPADLVSGNLTLTENALAALGFNAANRKYLIFVDYAAVAANDVNCGIGDLFKWDDQPGPANASNSGPNYARVGPDCWNGTNSAAAHELMHTLGAVQNSAPNWNGVGHCLDDQDRMCYDQGVAGFVFNPVACLNHERQYDCGHGDYFSTNPAAGSYLDTHWNTANSDFLDAGPNSQWGFVKANDPTNAGPYTPSDDYNQNSTGAKNTIVRTGTGSYAVTFTNLANWEGEAGTTLVTSLGSAGEHCNDSAWSSNGTADTTVTVHCWSAAGALVDSQFDAAYIRPVSSPGPFAYLWLDDETTSTVGYTPSTFHQFNSTGGINTTTRNAIGDYTVRLAGLSSDGGTVKVTGFSGSANFCKAEWWAPSGADELVEVRCFDSAGAAVNSKFTLVWADSQSILSNGASSAYVYSTNATPAPGGYTPPAVTNYNSSGALNTVVRNSLGSYTVTVPNLGSPPISAFPLDRGTIHVTATMATSKRCEVTGWSSPFTLPGSPIPVNVDVTCTTPAGALADSKFVLQFTK
jgi:hypothetical protein